jgi:thioesterase domain-containing protein
VALVAMFDSHFAAEEVPAQDMEDQSVLRWVARRLNMAVTELKEMPLERQWERIGARAKSMEGDGVAEIRYLADVCQAHLAALAGYSWEPYAGPVVLFKVGQDAGLDPRWRTLCPDLRVERVPGNHYTVLRPPHVNVLAERLGRYLAPTVGADLMARAR